MFSMDITVFGKLGNGMCGANCRAVCYFMGGIQQRDFEKENIRSYLPDGSISE